MLYPLILVSFFSLEKSNCDSRREEEVDGGGEQEEERLKKRGREMQCSYCVRAM